MAGDEDRPAPQPFRASTSIEDAASMTPSGSAGVHDAAQGTAQDEEAIAAQEPSMASASADLGGADRPAEAYAPAPVAVAPRRSLMPLLLSLIGVVLILLLLANLYTLYNPPTEAAVPALQADVAQLRQRLAAVPKVDLGPLDSRVSALAGEIGPLKAAIAGNTDAAAVAGDVKTTIGPLEAKVGDLDTRSAAVSGAVAALEKRLGTLSDTVAADAQKTAPLTTSIAALDKRLVPVEAYFTAPKSTAQVSEARQNGSAAESRAAPLAVIAQGILGALPAGRPFAAEAKALGTLGVDPATLAPLQAVADKGAATDAKLVSSFAGVQDGVVIAAAPVETGTMFDRMMANAQSLVKVTHTGAATGSDAGAVASRITADLKAGALTSALHEWEALPDASKTRSADWATRLKARVAAEDAARAVQDKAVAALAAAP